MEMRLVYITCSGRSEAEAIGKQIVKERLCAAVNIIDNMHSFYWWKGKIEESREAILIAKTTEELVHKLMNRVKELHSYECPCIISLPVEDSIPEFLMWLRSETKG
jgi:periplasmic divalent cation tolerance protein